MPQIPLTPTILVVGLAAAGGAASFQLISMSLFVLILLSCGALVVNHPKHEPVVETLSL